MNMKLDSLVVTTGTVWLALLLVALMTGASNAKPLDEAAGFHYSRKPSSSHRDWVRVRSSRTVPDFISGALEKLQHREKRFPRVPMGIKCSADTNCPADHCCAMKLGNAVCMPLLSRGRSCMVNSRSAYAPNVLFTQCPCSSLQELSCARRGSGNRGVCS
ncbi:uncharacterized protein [Asterias amurensis]|uniref:uncharacterized protein n=1 Tax=Asterias amurensis TaxID=7602 RepID=UPI003AB2B488